MHGQWTLNACPDAQVPTIGTVSQVPIVCYILIHENIT